MIETRETPLAPSQFTSLRSCRTLAIDRRIGHFAPTLDETAYLVKMILAPLEREHCQTELHTMRRVHKAHVVEADRNDAARRERIPSGDK